MINVRARSTKLVEELQRRARSLAGRKPTIKIVAPPSLRWWVWLEYGTANLGVHGGATYPIDPVNAKLLSWVNEGGNRIFRSHVDHPGIRPRRFVEKARSEIVRMLQAETTKVLVAGGYDYGAFTEALTETIGPLAKAMIVESLAIETSQSVRSDTGARLPGRTAAEAFDELAELVLE